jgi:hypothetical protein
MGRSNDPKLGKRLDASRGAAMPAEAVEIFDRFTALANADHLHPLDWQRWFDLVDWWANSGEDLLDENDLARVLWESGFRSAEDLAAFYQRGVDMLRYLDDRE